MSDNDNSPPPPPLIRPIPRRPFQLNLTKPSPPPPSLDSDAHPEQPAPYPHPLPTPSAFARLLDSRNSFTDLLPSSASHASLASLASAPSEAATPSLSRTQSVINLTSSTLFGIYSHVPFGREEADTPWGTGAQTPIRRPGLDDTTFELMRRRANSAATTNVGPAYRSFVPQLEPDQAVLLPCPPSAVAGALSLAARFALLFLLGMGYGGLVTRLHDGHHLTAFAGEGIIKPGQDWRFVSFWGVAGVALAVLFPWFDGLWERAFAYGARETSTAKSVSGGGGTGTASTVPTVAAGASAGTDWALVIRGVGAFIGIVFAIRKLPWTSTLQVSVTLALVNPFLWYLIDRSKPGFLLSAAVALTGSAVILVIDPTIVPTPSATAATAAAAAAAAASSAPSSNASISSPAPGRSDQAAAAGSLGGLTNPESMATAIWMLSVLFCSCVCFGNIGRRLALNRSALGRERWAGSM